MRVKKKNSFASFLFMIFIFCIVSIALIITLIQQQTEDSINDYQNSMQENYETLESLLNKLKSSTKGLETGLKNYVNSVEKLEEEIEKWKDGTYDPDDYNEATLVRAEKLLLLAQTLEDFENRIDDLGFDYDELLIYGSSYPSYVSNLFDNAWIQLERAATVEKQDKIIADFKNTLYTMPTRVEKVYLALEELEKDGITLSDKGNINTVIYRFNDMPKDKDGNPLYTQAEIDSLYAPDEKEALLERLDTAILAYIPLVVENFNEQITNNLSHKYTSIENEQVIRNAESTRDDLKYLCESQSEDVQRAYRKATAIGTDYRTNEKALEKHRTRLNQLLAAKAAAESINETIANYDKAAMMPNSNTLAELQDIEAAIKEWSANSKHQIVTDELHVKNKCTEQLHKGDKAVCEHCGYVAANYNLVNHSAFDSLMSEYAKLTSNGLLKVVSEIIDALNDIYENNDTVYYTVNVTLNDEDAIDNLIEAYQKLWSDSKVKEAGLASTLPTSKEKGTDLLYNTKYDAALAEIDYVLCLEEDGETDGIDTLSGAIAQLRQAKTDYDYIVAEVAKFNTFVTDTVMEKDADGKPTKNYSVAYILGHQDDLLEMDKLIYNLIVDYDLDSFVDVIEEKTDDGKKLTDPEKELAALLDAYMEIRLVPDYVELVGKIEDGVASHKGKATQSLAEDIGEELLARAQQLLVEDYEFAPKIEIVGGLSQYVGVGIWSDKTNKTKLEMKAIYDNLDESFTINNPIVSN